MFTPELAAALRPVLAALEHVGAAYFVTGSVTSSIYGSYRTTNDVDVVANLQPPHVDGLVDQLEAEFYISRQAATEAIEQRANFNVIHYDTGLKVDLFVLGGQPYDREAFSRAKTDKVSAGENTVELRVAAAEDVILSKLRWYRRGDEVSDTQWRDVLSVLTIQRDNLDSDYLRKWSAELHVADLLEKAFNEAGL